MVLMCLRILKKAEHIVPHHFKHELGKKSSVLTKKLVTNLIPLMARSVVLEPGSGINLTLLQWL